MLSDKWKIIAKSWRTFSNQDSSQARAVITKQIEDIPDDEPTLLESLYSDDSDEIELP